MEKEWNDLEHAKHLLEEGSCTCAMVKGDQQYTSKAHGVKPLLQWYHEGVDLKDFSAADQIVGKAAAFLYLQMGVKELYCKVVSKRGKELLLQSGMPIEYERLVPEIKNRTGDDMCPMERTVEHISDGTEAVEALTRKVQEMMAYH